MYPTSFVGDLHPVHPLDAFGRPEPCQNGLVEDHSGGYRIEPLRPSGVLVGYRPGEVRPGEVRLSEVRPGKVRTGKVRTGEVR